MLISEHSSSSLCQRRLHARRKSKHPFLKQLAFTFRLHCSVVQCIYLRDTRLCVLSVPGVGVRNITALGNLISWQKVDYDFNYHQMEFPCNINVLIASEGRSLLPVRTSGLSPFQRFIIKILPTGIWGRIRESDILISNRWK